METNKALTYSSYLKLPELLSLQEFQPGETEHDEMLFIIIHQVYELWFKEVLHELDHVRTLLSSDRVPPALDTLKRILTVLKIMVAQLDILETMTPLQFTAFRDRLESASGFQSAQFRELEFVLGMKDRRAIGRFLQGTDDRVRLERRFEEPTVWDAFVGCLASEGYPVPGSVLERDVTTPVAPSPELQRVLLDVYRQSRTLGSLCERLVDLDEGLQEWRYRHVKMVQRTIGTKRGTGGSAGADYLRTTLFQPCFPDLWDIRAEL